MTSGNNLSSNNKDSESFLRTYRIYIIVSVAIALLIGVGAGIYFWKFHGKTDNSTGSKASTTTSPATRPATALTPTAAEEAAKTTAAEAITAKEAAETSLATEKETAKTVAATVEAARVAAETEITRLTTATETARLDDVVGKAIKEANFAADALADYHLVTSKKAAKQAVIKATASKKTADVAAAAYTNVDTIVSDADKSTLMTTADSTQNI